MSDYDFHTYINQQKQVLQYSLKVCNIDSNTSGDSSADHSPGMLMGEMGIFQS